MKCINKDLTGQFLKTLYKLCQAITGKRASSKIKCFMNKKCNFIKSNIYILHPSETTI